MLFVSAEEGKEYKKCGSWYIEALISDTIYLFLRASAA
jgi:hypothetical protein